MGCPFKVDKLKNWAIYMFSEKYVLLGFNDNDQCSYSINLITLTTKYDIFKCKKEGHHTSFQALKSHVRHICHIEELASHSSNNKNFTASLRVLKSICS